MLNDQLIEDLGELAVPETPKEPEPDKAVSEETGDAVETSAEKEVAEPSSGVKIVDYTAKGFHLDTRVASEDVVKAAEILDRNGFAIECITGVDWIEEGEMEVVYDFFHFDYLCRAVIRTRIPRDKPELPTLSKVYPGADWHERETHDFFGINFIGHRDLSPFLLPDDADYHPLKKDFVYEPK